LHMLIFSSSYDGQGAIAVQAGKDYAKITKNSMYHVLTLLRFNRFDEIPAISEKPEGTVPAGLWEFAQGYAAMRNGKDAEARRYLQSVQSTANTSEKRFGADSAKHLLGSVGKLLEGELYLQGGDPEAAITSFETAVELEDALNYSEPEPLPFAARHWLGAALLEAERFSDAEKVYREELVDHPHNGWSLIGLQSALQAQGKTDAAVDEDFESSWARSDIWATSSRF
jgi:tetratricopeptide (TPR) repeat protein